ncbi:hypothetical protein [Massilia cavernae]|uniref:hypothetical protein n=1 Tax=Massilia cavernae TaxID=2320864 RepID=UPI0011C3B55E|nr:hypothetical protein [Massilia cavernae]
MGYLSDRDLNKEFGFEKANAGRDYIGGREERNLEKHFKDRAEVGSQRDHPNQDDPDYLGMAPKREEMEKLVENLGKREERATYNKETNQSLLSQEAKSWLAMMARAISGAVVGGKIGKIIRGSPIFVAGKILLKPVKGPTHGEDMLPPQLTPPSHPPRLP